MNTPQPDPDPVPRSWLYVPGHRKDLHPKALRSGADAVIFDLEDGVPADRRDEAARLVSASLAELPPGGTSPRLAVRVAGTSAGLELIDVLRDLTPIERILVAKSDTAETLALFAARAGLPVTAVVETAATLARLGDLTTSGAIAAIQLGEADLAADLGLPIGQHRNDALGLARSMVVYAAAAAGLERPVASASTEFADLAHYERDTETLRGLGFFGRTCIHPAQVAVANQVFTPRRVDVRWATELLRDAPGDGGAFVSTTGGMADEAVLRSARRILADTDSYGVRED